MNRDEQKRAGEWLDTWSGQIGAREFPRTAGAEDKYRWYIANALRNQHNVQTEQARIQRRQTILLIVIAAAVVPALILLLLIMVAK